MKRPVVIAGLSFIIGIVLSPLFRQISPWFILVFIIPLAVRPLLPTALKGTAYQYFLTAAFFMTIAIMETNYIESKNMSGLSELLDKKASLTFQILSEPDIRDGKALYTAGIVEALSDKGEKLKSKSLVKLTVYEDYKQGADFLLPYGSCWSAEGTLRLPAQVRNPGGFDYRRYLKTQGIYACLYVSAGQLTSAGHGDLNKLAVLGKKIRDRVTHTIKSCLPQREAGLLCGMLVGVTEGIDEEVKRNFSNCGLSHIVAVSGMNVAFLLAPCLWIFKKSGFHEKLACGLSIPVLIIFLFVTGISPSIFRAVLMSIMLLLSKMLDRDTDVYTSVAFSALVLLMINPYSLYDVGFQLSYGGTLSLCLLYPSVRKIFGKIKGVAGDTIAATIAAQIGLTPVTAFHFNQISVLSPISNLLVVPLVEAITLLGFAIVLAGLVFMPLASLVAGICFFPLWYVLKISELFSRIPFSSLQTVTPSPFFMAAYYLTALLFLWYLPRKAGRPGMIWKTYVPAFLILVCTLVPAMLVPGWLFPKELEVTFLDVGQGDSVFVRTPEGKSLLIDGGGDIDYDVGESVVVPFLLEKGIRRLNGVMATHYHLDHVGGLEAVFKSFDVETVFLPYSNYSEEAGKFWNKNNLDSVPEAYYVANGDLIRLDEDVLLRILGPVDGLETGNENNRSIVCQLVYNNIEFLFTGDMETEEEQALLALTDDLSSSVLKVAHHGADTGMSRKFLESVRPLVAVISVGRNSFGHPSNYVLDRLKEAGAIVLRTDQCGAITIRTDGKRLRIKQTIQNMQSTPGSVAFEK